MKNRFSILIIAFLLILFSVLAITQPPLISLPDVTPKNASHLGLDALFTLLAAFAASGLSAWLILKYEHLHAHISHDHVDQGPQKYHEFPTPRIGGIAIMVGLLTVFALFKLRIDTQSLTYGFGFLLLASLPAFLGGVVEDLTKKVGVLERLLLTMLAGSIAAWLLAAVLPRLDFSAIDMVFAWQPFAVLFTVFAVGGLANAVNIIDGYNGLASGFSIIVLFGLAFVGYLVGDTFIMFLALGLAGAILGFFVWNWPRGRIFLGDGGAYLIGFMLAELSILLVVRNPEVSPWFPLALLIYPVFETLYSIYRRKIHHATSPGQPDNRHLHQLVHDHLLLPLVQTEESFSRLKCNSRVAKYFWGPAVVMAILAGMFWSSTPWLIAFILSFCIFYVMNYRRITRLALQKLDQEE